MEEMEDSFVINANNILNIIAVYTISIFSCLVESGKKGCLERMFVFLTHEEIKVISLLTLQR